MRKFSLHTLIYSFFLLFSIVFFAIYTFVGDEYKLQLGEIHKSREKDDELYQVNTAGKRESISSIEEDKITEVAGVRVVNNKQESISLKSSVLSYFEKKERKTSGMKGSVLSVIDERTTSTFSLESEKVTLSGTLSVVWGDSTTGEDNSIKNYYLKEDSGQISQVKISDELLESSGGTSQLQGKDVQVTAEKYVGSFSATNTKQTVFVAETISVENESVSEDRPISQFPVSGSQNWFTIPCKFADKSVEPTSVSYFEAIMDGEYPHMDHYWREVSYNKIDLEGTYTAPQWYTLPGVYDSYFYSWGGTKYLDPYKFKDDCYHAYTGNLDLTQFEGINFIANYYLGGFAWGGTFSVGSHFFAGTILDSTAYYHLKYVAHEMGHGFGFDHSIGGGTMPEYGSKWDVMSGGNEIHPISYHKYHAAWITPEEAYVPKMNSRQIISLDRLALPPREEGSYLMVIIPFKDSEYEYYTLELRTASGYDANGLPAEGIVIHRVNDYDEMAFVIDEDEDGDVNDAGGVWTAGEVFKDPANDITIRVLGESGPPGSRDGTSELQSMEVEISRGGVANLTARIANKYSTALVSSSAFHLVGVGNYGPDNATNVVATSKFPSFVTILSKPDFCIERTEGNSKFVECSIGTLLGPQTLDDVSSTTLQMFQLSYNARTDINGDGKVNAMDYGNVLSVYQTTQGSISLIPEASELGLGYVISSGQMRYYDIQFRSDQEGPVAHTVSITGGEIDPDTTNNTFQVTTNFVDINNLVPTITSPKDGQSIQLGDDIEVIIGPMPGISEYEVKLYQDGTLINITKYTSTGPQFTLTPRDEEYSLLQSGPLEIRARVRMQDQWSAEKIITVQLVEYIPGPLVWTQPSLKGSVISIYSCYVLKVQPLQVDAAYLFQIYQGGVLKYGNWRDTGNLSSDGTQYLVFDTTTYSEGLIELHAKARVEGEWTPDSVIYASLSSNAPPSCRL